MDIALVVANGSKAGQVIPVVGEKFLIGRADDCNLKPRSELVSRYHCAIVSGAGFVAVRDLGSKNGVYVNGERVSLECELKNGDTLNVGPLSFTIQLSSNLSATKPKLPRVETVEQALVRTVQRAEETARAEQQHEEPKEPVQENKEEETSAADWLLGLGESLNDQETRTVEIDQDSSTVSVYVPEPSDPLPSKPESSAKPESKGRKEAATNMLKNFFKGGK
ncbi:MAG: FHA domain-containing protein [Thermoguttaceae bacterium]